MIRKQITDRPIFIIGAPRSGTTLLRMILNAHPKIASPHECKLILSVINRYPNPKNRIVNFDHFLNYIYHIRRFKEVFNLDQDQLVNIYQKLQDPNPVQLIGCIYRLSQGYDPLDITVRWCDKYIGYAEFVPQLSAYFPHSQFIHIIRNVYDSVSSISTRMGRAIGTYQTLTGPIHYVRHPVGASLLWKQMVSASETFGSELGPEMYYRIRYEDLIRDTEMECQKLCGFLKLPFDKNMLEYYKPSRIKNTIPKDSILNFHENITKPILNNRIGVANSYFNKFEIMVIESICGPLMIRCGYSLSSPFKKKSKWIQRWIIFSYKIQLSVLKVVLSLYKLVPRKMKIILSRRFN